MGALKKIAKLEEKKSKLNNNKKKMYFHYQINLPPLKRGGKKSKLMKLLLVEAKIQKNHI